MRIDRAAIDGYGRFSGLDLEFAPDLQILVGPNERGKSTLRSFIADMLFGQTGDGTAAEAEARDLRTPWANPSAYGGRLVCAFENGESCEIMRNFGTGEATLRAAAAGTGESHPDGYIEQRLGISKPVFLGTATISHLTLEGLGEHEALNQIREKLLSLADADSEGHSAMAAVQHLDAHIRGVGRPGQAGKPLPDAQARLDELERERIGLVNLRGELAPIEERRAALRRRAQALQAEIEAIERKLRQHEARARAERLRAAEALSARIDEVTQESFVPAAARDFPQDRTPEMQRCETRLNTARLQRSRSQGELAAVESDLAARETGAPARDLPPPLDPALEDAFTAARAAVQRLEERAAQLRAQAQAARDRIEETQAALAAFPDFSRIAPDPVAWLTQLATSFDVAVRARDKECGQRAVVRAETRQRRERLRPLAEAFAGVDDFLDLARAYEEGQRLRAEDQRLAATRLQTLLNEAEEAAERIPGFRFLSAGLGVFLAVLLAAWVMFQINAMVWPAICTLFGMLYFLGNYVLARRRLEQTNTEIADARAHMNALAASEAGDTDHPVVRLMAREGCETVRELEARYDTFRRQSAELAAREEVLADIERQAAEAEERVDMLLDNFRGTFEQVGETVLHEDDVRQAAGNALTRYQDYREAKGRLLDARALFDRLQNDARNAARELEEARAREAEAADRLRAVMRENGFADTAACGSVADALRAYREQAAAAVERRGGIEALREKRAALAARLQAEEREVQASERALNAVLAAAGVESPAAWHEAAERAAKFRELHNHRLALEAQLATLLGDGDFNALRDAVREAGEPEPAPPEESREQLLAQRAAIETEAAAITREERELQLQINERMAGQRSLNEVEEDIALAARRVARLGQERESAAYAMAVIEEIARDRHARVAPRLAEIASGYLAEITDGAYTEIRLERDFGIHVCVPGSGRVLERPERSLSKGAMDQVYLALRLALVQSLSHSREPIPMLLDDPFANYDDERLRRTMRLLARIARGHQVILFTCRDDVTRAAETVSAAITRL